VPPPVPPVNNADFYRRRRLSRPPAPEVNVNPPTVCTACTTLHLQ